MTFQEATRAAASRLARAGLETPELDARALAMEAFGLDHGRLIAVGLAEAPAAALERLEGLVGRRLAGEPVDRILGRREFWGMEFALSPATLSPRPETETIVEAALSARPQGAVSVLDLGTGSGCILLALLSEWPQAFGVGVDQSPQAAASARNNALALGFAARAAFVAGDWAAALAGRFDVVVSNPPYIESSTIDGLAVEVRTHDPRLALDGGAEGLDAYRAILPALPSLLAPDGVAALELGAGQAAEVSRIAREGGLRVLRAVEDLSGVPRALLLQRN